MDLYDDPLLVQARNMVVGLTERLLAAEVERAKMRAEKAKLRDALRETIKFIDFLAGRYDVRDMMTKGDIAILKEKCAALLTDEAAPK